MDDKEAIRRDHGVGLGVYVNPVDMYTGPIHDSSDAEVARREHGAGIGVYVNPVDKYTGPIHDTSDAEAIRRDHGVGLGVYVNPVDMYTGPIHDSSDAEVARREHGAGIGVPVDGMITYGTRDQELKDIVNNLIHSNGVKNLEGVISKLPDEAIIRIIQLRYRNIVTRLQDRRGLYRDVLQELSKDIMLDYNIIRIALQQRRNLFDKSFNASIYVGQENEQNIVGLLEEYQSELEQVMISIPLIDGVTNMPVINPTTNQPYEAYDYAHELKKEAKNIAVEMGIDIGEKSL